MRVVVRIDMLRSWNICFHILRIGGREQRVKFTQAPRQKRRLNLTRFLGFCRNSLNIWISSAGTDKPPTQYQFGVIIVLNIGFVIFSLAYTPKNSIWVSFSCPITLQKIIWSFKTIVYETITNSKGGSRAAHDKKKYCYVPKP